MTGTHPAMIDRRRFLTTLVAAGVLAAGSSSAFANPADLDFDDLYVRNGPLGLAFSEKLKALKGQSVMMRGYMAPPLKAEANFFVLTHIPMALCPFCSSDADWPEDIVAIYLNAKQTFVLRQALLAVEGIVEIGSWTDPDTGFVSQVRLAEASFRTA